MTEKEKQQILSEKVQDLVKTAESCKCSALAFVTGDTDKENEVMQMMGAQGNVVQLSHALVEIGRQDQRIRQVILCAASMLMK